LRAFVTFLKVAAPAKLPTNHWSNRKSCY